MKRKPSLFSLGITNLAAASHPCLGKFVFYVKTPSRSCRSTAATSLTKMTGLNNEPEYRLNALKSGRQEPGDLKAERVVFLM